MSNKIIKCFLDSLSQLNTTLSKELDFKIVDVYGSRANQINVKAAKTGFGEKNSLAAFPGRFMILSIKP
jgi:ribosomal protein S24E